MAITARDALVTIGLVVAAGAAISVSRPVVANMHHQVKESADVYVLPPPKEVVTLSMGYRSAVADLIWANVLVSQGLHTSDRRRYGNLTGLLDTINELEPTYAPPYEMADALITFQSEETPDSEVRKARQIMERGVKELPLNGRLWRALGGFVAFIAPSSYLHDPKEQAQWRLDGARYLAQASELDVDGASIGWSAFGAVGIFERANERDATIRFLRRNLAVTDDPELRERLQAKLAKYEGEEAAERKKVRLHKKQALRDADVPFMSRAMLDLLGPPRWEAYCAGDAHADDERCAFTWRAWTDLQEQPSGR